MQGAGTCDLSTMKSRVESINAACCDKPGQDCSGGKLSACDESCAAVLVPLWHDCEAELADDAQLVREAVDRCGCRAGARDVRRGREARRRPASGRGTRDEVERHDDGGQVEPSPVA